MSKKRKNDEIDVSDSLEDLLGIKRDSNRILDEKDKLPSDMPSANKIPEKTSLNINPGDLSRTPHSDGRVSEFGEIRMLPSSLIGDNSYIQCPQGISKIKVTRKAFEDMVMVAKAVNEISKEKWGPSSEKLEVYMYVLADPDEINPHVPATITEIYIPYHRASEARVDVDERGILELKDFIRETGKVLLGWAHSHGHFDVYSSHTDEINHQILLNETSNFLDIPPFKLKYIYGITINDKGERFGVILTHYPCGHVERREDEEFEIIGEPYSELEKRERYELIKDLVRERATLIKPHEVKTIDGILDDLVEEIMYKYYNNMNKAKDILINSLDEKEQNEMFKIMGVLEKYESLLMDGLEETIKTVAKKLIGLYSDIKDDI